MTYAAAVLGLSAEAVSCSRTISRQLQHSLRPCSAKWETIG